MHHSPPILATFLKALSGSPAVACWVPQAIFKENASKNVCKVSFSRGHQESLKPGQQAAANQLTLTSGCGLVHLDGMTAAPRWASQ